MPNNYFQFKHFTVQQDQCAMKVCTDACLFAAYVAGVLSNEKISSGIMLDIGAGSGVLSLMLAQKTTGNIHAVEIDPDACFQAKENFERSQWNHKLAIFNTDILQFNNSGSYSCIISNPPFFEKDLKSGSKTKNAAKHDTTLTIAELFQVVVKYLAPDGLFAVLLPYHRLDESIRLASTYGLHCSKKIKVRQTPRHDYFRAILLFSRSPVTMSETDIIIKNENDSYSENFIQLLKDYYLYL